MKHKLGSWVFAGAIFFSSLAGDMHAQDYKSTIKDFIPIIQSQEDQSQTLFIRRSELIYKLNGFSKADSDKIISKIELIALEMGISYRSSFEANIHIISNSEFFNDGMLDEPKVYKFGFPKIALDRLKSRMFRQLNCVSGSDSCETNGVGFSIVFMNSNLSEQEKWNCIDRGIIESMGFNTRRFINCLVKCFEKPLDYNVRLLFQITKICELQIQNKSLDPQFGHIFSDCFWELYRSRI